MRATGLAVSLAAALCAAGGSGAKDIPSSGLAAQDVAIWLRGAGVRAEVVAVPGGVSHVRAKGDGVTFEVYLFDCTGEPCANLQFSARFDPIAAGKAVRLAEWNRRERWARAYIDPDGDPRLEQDVDIAPGGTYESLNDQLVYWRIDLTRFKRDYLGR